MSGVARLIAITFMSRTGTAVLNFLTIILLSRFLGPDGKGIATRLIVIISGIQIVCDFMGGAALVYLSSRYSLRSLLVPAWTWSILVSITALILIRIIDPGLFQQYGAHIAVLSIINSTLNQHLHIFNGREKFRWVNLLNLLQALLIGISLFIFLKVDTDVFAYTMALYVGWGIVWLISLVLLAEVSKKPAVALQDREATEDNWENVIPVANGMRILLKYSFSNQFGHLLQFANQRIAYFLLVDFALGIYSNAVSLAESVWLIASSIAMIQYGKIANNNDKNKAAEMTAVLFRSAVLLSTLACLVLLLVPVDVYTFLFGKEFAPVKENLLFLLPGIIFISGYLIIGHYFSGTGQFMKNNYAIAAGLAVTILSFGFLYISGERVFSHFHAAVITSCANAATFFSVIWLFKTDSRKSWRVLLPHPDDLVRIKAMIQQKRKKNVL